MDFGFPTIAILLLLMHGCIGQEVEGGDEGAADLAFKVTLSPDLSEKTVNQGESLVLFCSYEAPAGEKPTLRWMKDDVEITETSPTARVRVAQAGNDYVLRLTNIVDNDRGSYMCEGSLAGQTDSAKIIVQIVKPLEIKSPADQHGLLGKDGDVNCDVSAKPAPTIIWRFDNGTEIKNNQKYVITTNRLQIKNLQMEDEGSYLCDMMVRDTGEAKTFAINYQVVKVPVMALRPTIEPNNAKVGDTVKIHCVAEGKPEPTYSFEKDGNPMNEDKYDANTGILTIQDLQRKDEAEYKCIASNLGGSVNKSNSLDVKIPPVIQDIPNIGDAAEEALQTIECVAEGDPAPSLTWRKKGMDTDYSEGQDHPRFSTESSSPDNAEIKVVKSTLTFDPIKAQDAGEYVCTALNDVGTATKEMRMDVKYKPHFDVPYTQDTFYGWENNPANLTCQASANEMATIEWMRPDPADPDNPKAATAIEGEPGGVFAPSEHRTQPDQHLVSRSLKVNIQGDDDSLFGEYFCVATNVLGSATKTVVLRRATPPNAPKVELPNTLSTMVSVAVEKPNSDGGQPITKYSYEYHKDGDAANPLKGNVGIEGEPITFTLKDLSPATPYVLKVWGSNAVGKGSEASITFTTREVSEPQKPEIVSNPVGDQGTSYILRWKEPDNGGSPITKFIIHHRQVKVKDDQNPDKWVIVGEVDPEAKKEEIPGGAGNSYELKSLKRDSYYEIRIKAVNKEGPSEEAFKLVKTGAGNVPAGEVDKDKSSSSGGQDGNKSVGDSRGAGAASTDDKKSASAGLGTGIIIAIIVIIIVLLLVIALVGFFVVKKKRAAAHGDVEGGQEVGKETAEQEKLIQEDNTKVESEKEKEGDGIEEKQEFEPDQKPEQPPPATTEPVVDENAKEEPPSEPTIQITPETPEKPDNPAA